jgi:hypothetical protein
MASRVMRSSVLCLVKVFDREFFAVNTGVLAMNVSLFRRTSSFFGLQVGLNRLGAGVMLSVNVAIAAQPETVSTTIDRSAASAVSSSATAASDIHFTGNQVCASCHQEKSETYGRTSHALTSRPGARDAIRGHFAHGLNVLRTANPRLFFQMDARDDGLFQTAVIQTSLTEGLTRSERFDIVVGSGRKGQTYLYWDADRLYQLPVSYWSQQDAWVNSPGYVDGTAEFERPIAGRCLECHASSFVPRGATGNSYERASLVLGISCEKCHGPGSGHVTRHSPGAASASFLGRDIVNPAKLPRDRQIDGCALCHAGAGQPLTPPLSYSPGEVLSEHLVFPKQPADAHIDVHASQVQLLARSRCFQSSSAMTCSTCHEVHQTQHDLAAFAQKCLTCHQPADCHELTKRSGRGVNACVNCHMPLEGTQQILIAEQGGKNLEPMVRNHTIAIYPNLSVR